MHSQKGIYLALFLLLLIFPGLLAQDKPLDYDQVRADEAGRDGTVLFHSGQYNRAVLSFEKALQYKPASLNWRSWLAEALYAGGLEEQALTEWNLVLKGQGGDAVLENRVEVLSARRSMDPETLKNDRYLPLFELNGKNSAKDGKPLFLRPTSVKPLPDGGFLVAAFGSEDLMQFSAEGSLVKRFVGGLGRLRAPFDVLTWRDRYYVSEFTADQVSILDHNGLRIKSFGGKGLKDGKFLGPQFLATDGQAIYVSDWGNARISKFDMEGNFLLSFGAPTPGFDGLLSPTGLTATEDKILVADKKKKAVFAFDTSGNWLATYGEGQLSGPEGLSLTSDGLVLIGDASRVFVLDPASESVTPFDPEWSQGLKVIQAGLDANRQLILTDFDANKIRILAPGHTIYGGFLIHIVQIDTRSWPQVVVSFTVEDRWGRPVTGLDSTNFILSESKTRVVNTQLVYQGFKHTESQLSLVIDRSPTMTELGDSVSEAIDFFSQDYGNKGGLGIYGADKNPVLLNNPLAAPSENKRVATDPASITPMGKFDLAVHMAAASMVPSLKRRTVLYLTAGTLPPKAFARYDLPELTAFLRNNGITFSVLSLNDQPLSEELKFLMNQTGGKEYSINKDLRLFDDDLKNRASGLYALKYNSITPAENGTRQIPIALEVNRFGKQSGRGELSYFGPE